MKTKFICALLCLIFILSLVSCDKGESKYKDDVTSKALGDAIVDAINAPQGFLAPDSDFIEFNMEGATALCEDYCIMLSSMNINYNEFGIMRAKNEDDAKKLADICQSYIDIKKEGANPHYLPQEYPKIENAKVKIYGCYVVYTVLSDADAKIVENTITEKLAK